MRELRERLVAEQHDEGLLAHRHAGGRLAGEPRVVAEPEPREECLAALEIRYRDAYEQHPAGGRGGGHGGSPVGDSMAYALADRLIPQNSSAAFGTRNERHRVEAVLSTPSRIGVDRA